MIPQGTNDMTARRNFLITIGFFFLAGLGVALAQEGKTAPAVKDVAFYQDHGIFRQFGASLAELTAPDIASKIIVGWKYHLADVPDGKMGNLLKHLKANKVNIAVDLIGGGYAVMTPAVAQKLGLISFNDAGTLAADLKSKSGLNIISPYPDYFDVKSMGIISHWNDETFFANDFAVKYSGKLVGTSINIAPSQ